MIVAAIVVGLGLISYLVGRLRRAPRVAELGRGFLWLGGCAAGVALMAQAGGCSAAARDFAAESRADLRPAMDKAVAVALDATNAARDAFTAWDRSHQLKIATSAPDPVARLSEYRARREVVVLAFEAAYAAIEAAAALVPLADRPKSLADLVAQLAAAGGKMAAARDAFSALAAAP